MPHLYTGHDLLHILLELMRACEKISHMAYDKLLDVAMMTEQTAASVVSPLRCKCSLRAAQAEEPGAPFCKKQRTGGPHCHPECDPDSSHTGSRA